MTVWIYDQGRDLKVFATEEADKDWLDDNDPEGVAFECEVIEAAYQRQWRSMSIVPAFGMHFNITIVGGVDGLAVLEQALHLSSTEVPAFIRYACEHLR